MNEQSRTKGVPTANGKARSSHRIVLISLVSDGFGGLETHVLNLARQLKALGHFAVLVVPRSSALHKKAEAEGLDHEPISWVGWVRGQPIRNFLLYRTLLSLGRRTGATVLHCNNRFEIRGAQAAARMLGACTVFNYHVPDRFDAAVLAGVDAVVTSNAEAANFIASENRLQGLGLRCIEVLPPMFDAQKFRAFHDDTTCPSQWFEMRFNIALTNDPIVCMVGNMVSDLEHKNYPLLFRAIRILRVDREIPVQAVLVGDGPSRAYLEKLAAELEVTRSVRFLGFRSEEVPGIIAKSDLCVLASNHEAFGIVLVEAALMGKPAVAARGTGAEQIIMDGETGLLFANGSDVALANAIERLICSPELSVQLGRAALLRADRLFVPEAVVSRYLEVYAAMQS